MKLLSIVLPAYNEEENISEAVKALGGLLEEQLPDLDYELIFVNDGSGDGTFEQIREAMGWNSHVKGLSFSRNFGKEAAIFAGLEASAGDAVVVMDCDLQHPPEVIPQMVEKWQKGAEVVEGIKASRGRESLGYKLSAGIFYKIMSALIHIDMNASSDYKLLDRKVVNVLLELPEHNTFFRALSFWAGFRRESVSYEVQERVHGQSKWSLRSLVRYAIRNASSFSTLPLQLVTWMGWISVMFGIIMTISTLFNYLTHRAVEGFTTVILLELILGGFIMIALGILGHYLARIYEEVKGRPRYIIAEVTDNVSDRLCGAWHVRRNRKNED